MFQEILRCKNSGTLGLFTTQTMQLKWKWDQQIELNLLTLLNYHQKVFSVKKFFLFLFDDGKFVLIVNVEEVPLNDPRRSSQK